MKLSEPVTQPCRFCEAAIWSLLEDELVALWSVVDAGAAFWSGLVDGLELLGAVLCAKVIAAPSRNVAKSVFFILIFPLYCCKCICLVFPPAMSGEFVAFLFRD